MKKETLAILVFLIILIISAGLCLKYPCFQQSFEDASNFSITLKNYLDKFGLFAPLAFIFILALQVVLAPIPGQIFGLASGFIYGPFVGTLLSMLGLALGSFIAFYLSRKFGRPLVEKFVSKKHLKKFDYLTNKKGSVTLFIIFLLPVFPDDAICFIAGLTRIPLPTLMIIAVIGRLPGFLTLNFVGAGFAYEKISTAIILFTILMVISGLTYIYRKDLENAIHRIVQK